MLFLLTLLPNFTSLPSKVISDKPGIIANFVRAIFKEDSPLYRHLGLRWKKKFTCLESPNLH